MPRVRVLLFSILREAAGSRVLEVDVPEGCSVRCLLQRLAERVPRLARALEILEWDVNVLVNGRPAGLDDPVGGEVAILPPAAGGSCRCKGEVLEGRDVDLDEVVEWLSGSSSDVGAVALFVGVVRGVNEGERVEVLEYEHHPGLASRVLERIAREVAGKYNVRGVYIGHYVGPRRPGERTLIVAVAGPHRSDVYPALQEAVERVKREAPIWKTEHRRGGRRVFIIGERVVGEEELEG